MLHRALILLSLFYANACIDSRAPFAVEVELPDAETPDASVDRGGRAPVDDMSVWIADAAADSMTTDALLADAVMAVDASPVDATAMVDAAPAQRGVLDPARPRLAALPEYTACFLVPGERLYCWGQRFPYSIDSFGGDTIWPQAADEHLFESVVAPYWHVSVSPEIVYCVLSAHRTVQCFGTQGGRLPNGRRLSSLSHMIGSDGGLNNEVHHGCGIQPDGTITCWGIEQIPEGAGGGPAIHLNAPQGEFKQVAVAIYLSCGLRMDGRVECWGSDEYTHGSAVWRGRLAVPDMPFKQLHAYAMRACGLSFDGDIRCWGQRAEPPFDVEHLAGPFTHLSSFGYGVCGLVVGGNIRCQVLGAEPFLIETDLDLIEIAAGYNFVCGRTRQETVKCWDFPGGREPHSYDNYLMTMIPPAIRAE